MLGSLGSETEADTKVSTSMKLTSGKGSVQLVIFIKMVSVVEKRENNFKNCIGW